MKLKPPRLLAAISLIASICTNLVGSPIGPLTLAVFDFEAKDNATADLGAKVSALLNVTLSAADNLVTVERAELTKILGEQELTLSGTVSAETATKVGHLTGARILVTGRVFNVEKETVLVAKIISAETSRVYGEMVKGRAPATELASELASKIAKTVTNKADTLVAKIETREQRVSRIKEELKDAKRLTAFVKVPERHYGVPANDPAAETELMKLLVETGFALTDQEVKADVVISGEAFSAAAGRKGNLYICKARVEVKATRKNGDILAADRETSVAVDLAEQTAGKTALQQAAESIAARLLPKLAK